MEKIREPNLTTQQVNKQTTRAYKIYAKFYAPVALLAYFIVWRGNILKHIAFYRNILEKHSVILDIATGDGSLTNLALFKGKIKPKLVTALDISKDMLEKAQKKLPKKSTEFVVGDVMNLPYSTNSTTCITCFGGFNSFPSGNLAMQEIARILKPGGVVRGSVLLLPKSPWRQNLIRGWIRKGYQTEFVTLSIFKTWIEASDLSIGQFQFTGDVLLFELEKDVHV